MVRNLPALRGLFCILYCEAAAGRPPLQSTFLRGIDVGEISSG